MDKRVLTTVLISMGILFVWTKFFAPPPPPPQHPQAVPTATSPATASPTSGPASVAGPAANQPTPAAKQGAVRPDQIIQTIDRPGYFRAKLTSWGAAASEWTLLNPQFQEVVVRDGKKQLQPINLVRTALPYLPLTISFPDSGFSIPADAAWTQVPSSSPDEQLFTWDGGAAHVEKRFHFQPNTYAVDVHVTVENRGDAPFGEHLQVGMYGWQDPAIKPGGMFSPRVIQTSGECDWTKLKQHDLPTLLKGQVDEVGPIRWVGIDEKYFVAAVAAKPTGEERKCSVSATPDGTISATMLMPERQVKPKEKTEYDLVGYFGPKFLDKLDDVRVGGMDAKLGDAVNYGWTEVIARPMLAVLKAVHKVVPNWGFAVIVLTILLKAATWWPTTKSMQSMKAMAKLKPEMDRLKEKYGADKQKMNVEVMGLYKQHGINPLGGCLPMLIQMPIYIALYSMLGNSVELYRSGFIGYIKDMTAPDPYFVLPLLTGVLMFLQQKLSPTPPDPQQKTMMIMMPIMFTAFSIFLPSGLTIYILTNTVLTMLQQWSMNRSDPRPALAKTKANEVTMNTMDEARGTLSQILTLMGVEGDVVAQEDGERITLEVKGPETALLVGKKGETLDAIQYLVNKIVSQKVGDEESMPINVDAGGYRGRRAEALTELAHRLADKARETGRPVSADPMSPADRRIIHVALADAKGLSTHSEGEGLHRHLVIVPDGGEAK